MQALKAPAFLWGNRRVYIEKGIALMYNYYHMYAQVVFFLGEYNAKE